MDLTSNDLYFSIKKKINEKKSKNKKPILPSISIAKRLEMLKQQNKEESIEQYFKGIILNVSNIANFFYNSVDPKIIKCFNNLEYLSITNNYLINLNFIINLPHFFYLDVYGNPLDEFCALNYKNIFGYLRLSVDKFHENKILAVTGLSCAIFDLELKDKNILRIFKSNNKNILMLNNEINYYIDKLSNKKRKIFKAKKTMRFFKNNDTNNNNGNISDNTNMKKNKYLHLNFNDFIKQIEEAENDSKYNSDNSDKSLMELNKNEKYQINESNNNNFIKNKSIKVEITNKFLLEIKSYFDVKGTLFKEIKSRDITMYSKFAKDMKLFFFGPKGMITQKNPHLKKYYNIQEKKKMGLNTKIYAGRWEYLEDTMKHNRYLNRLKSNRKKMIKIGGHFTTEDDVGSKIHDLFLKKKKIDERKKSKKEKEKESFKKALEKNKRRFSMTNDINKINIFNKNIFEYTSLEPYKRENSRGNTNFINTLNERKNRSRPSLPYIFQNKIGDLSNKTSIESKSDSSSSKTEVKTKKYNLDKIKNIFKREKIRKKINKENRKHFKKINFSIKTKLNEIIEPSRNLMKNIDVIKRNNKTDYNFRDNKDKYKEDIKVIVEDDRKDNEQNMNEFVKTNYKKQIIQKKSNIPVKIHFSYYDRSKANIHNSIKDFIRNSTRLNAEEREKKYHKNIKDQFHANCKIIEKLGMNLDNIKSKTNL